ncbi:hypothetical protein [Brachyspira hyodysenteriae]|uniref:hypothetical protein n=1 Tax=Brachyspira hyodysenteriae TaxID=159 RepID=UPI001ADD872E|nr:hypothetical protein [Brachyspira hyodysenteriae]MDA0080800.1 hypothetical protein [Brachyspira hyodysenteriae]QTM08721.1 hypothetical protein GQX60_07540 [Brachyspira hyodysenteriae]
MKTKILLIAMVILFAISCAKNNPSNPIQNNNKRNSLIGYNNGKIDNYGDKVSIDQLDGILEYGGKAFLTTKSLDGIDLPDPEGPEQINIYVDIYEQEKIAIVHIRDLFNFDDIKLDNNKNTYYSSDDKGNYTLTMKFGKDSITDFQLTVLFKGDNYKSYVTAEKLERIIRN